MQPNSFIFASKTNRLVIDDDYRLPDKKVGFIFANFAAPNPGKLSVAQILSLHLVEVGTL